MAEVLVRIAAALGALAVVAAFAVELRAHDLLANAANTAVQPHVTQAAVANRLRGLKTAEGLRPGSQAFLAAAALDLRTRRYAAAAHDATRAAQREPKNFSVWVTLAVALQNQGNKNGARAAYAKAHALNPLYQIPRL
jgi:Flp pilus assembly protein TadD